MQIKRFRTFESESDLLDDLEGLGFEKHKGWIVCTQAYYDGEIGAEIHAVVAKNIPEACQMILSEMGYPDYTVEEAKKAESFEDLSDIIDNEMGFGGRHQIAEVYEGLKPRKAESMSLLIDWINPIMAVKDINYVFTNANEIMGKSY